MPYLYLCFPIKSIPADVCKDIKIDYQFSQIHKDEMNVKHKTRIEQKKINAKKILLHFCKHL